MIHYHGGPITPVEAAMKAWKARHAFISYAHPHQIALAASICQSFALDNGAFTFWKQNKEPDWEGYSEWVQEWRFHPGFDFAVIPDVIEGTEIENDRLIDAWKFPKHQSIAVWHINESISRLKRLAEEWPRVAIGSSGEFDVKRPGKYIQRMNEVLPYICNESGFPICKLHGLRVLNPTIFTRMPFASGDSTKIARNIGIDSKWKGTYQPKSKVLRAAIIAEMTESFNGACRALIYDI